MSTTASPDVVIIGAGVSGLSTARALVELGVHDVLVLDRGAIGSGASGKSSGIVRCHYGIPSLAAMAWRALPVLANGTEILGADTGYRKTGYLVGVSADNQGALLANVAMQRGLGIDTSLVDRHVAQELWPVADLDDFAGFAYEPLGGHGDGHMTALAFATAARRGGARIRPETPVHKVEVQHDRVQGVWLGDGSFIATPTVILAAGPWSVALAADNDVEVPIRAQRAQILLIDPGADLGRVPVFSDLVSLQYVRTEGAMGLLWGDSDHSQPEWSDPDEYRERVTDAELHYAIPKFAGRFPGIADPKLAFSYAGCYDVTPDYNPVIGPSPVEGMWICAGFSGHGYKISPSTGELMADLVTSGHSRHPDINHHDFRLERFAEDDLLMSRHPYVGAGQMR